MRIAVVEDDGLVADLLKAILSGAGHDVDRVDQHDYTAIDADVVLLDLMMPDVGGEEILRWIRANRPGTRVVVASAVFIIPDSVKDTADAVITKPFTPEDLLEAL